MNEQFSDVNMNEHFLTDAGERPSKSLTDALASCFCNLHHPEWSEKRRGTYREDVHF
ncbi:hypothetical protein NY08_3799 [Rhodococcus sp. B7740]|nr:hypothetical protein NY08_3799 [Rhodococcus sp. B7740]